MYKVSSVKVDLCCPVRFSIGLFTTHDSLLYRKIDSCFSAQFAIFTEKDVLDKILLLFFSIAFAWQYDSLLSSQGRSRPIEMGFHGMPEADWSEMFRQLSDGDCFRNFFS